MALKDSANQSKANSSAIAQPATQSVSQPVSQPSALKSVNEAASRARSVLSAAEINATVAVNTQRAQARAELAGVTMISEYQGAMAGVMPVVAQTLDDIDSFYFGALYDTARVAYGLEPTSSAHLPEASVKSALPEGK